VALGAFCVVLSGAGYAAAFVYFDNAHERRNYLVFACWSAALLLAGSLLCLPRGWQPVVAEFRGNCGYFCEFATAKDGS